jgi:ADP-heptose:LPS heptosyltransferase
MTACRRRVLLARLDNMGDVLLTGPAVRAVASEADVVYLTSPQGRAAAEMLPGIRRIITHRSEWIDAEPPAVQAPVIAGLVQMLHRLDVTEACIFTSSHQSSLPLALLLRLAGVSSITAISHDYPGSLLDHRIPGDPDVHEVERNLLVVAAAGYELPADDAGLLRVDHRVPERRGGYVVVHPGASVPARTLAPERWRDVVHRIASAGRAVVVTGSKSEGVLAASVAASRGTVRTGLPLSDMATLLAGAEAVVVGNTGPAHLAAAVGTPVVEVFAPTVPAVRWRPWGVPSVLLGQQTIDCAGCRSRLCPLADQPCIAHAGPDAVVAALDELVPVGAAR